ncbi:glycosyltransferase involved in cell wall biosynthesis [Streptacidiphilus sp. BW17]|uniref:glycosyltransferase n=1 Tax=Streptacidiphilus sp. BW17 TaxID=3156274 RepID=UPI003511D6C0
MRIALVTESAATDAWGERLVGSLAEHEFLRLSTADAVRVGERRRATPPWGGRRGRALAAYGELVRTLVDTNPARAAAGFGPALYALAEAGRGGGLAALLRSGAAVRSLEHAWLGSGAVIAAGAGDAGVPLLHDVLVAADLLERALRPLSLPWYQGRAGRAALAGADVCHVVGGSAAALPALVAKRQLGLPFLLTEHSLHLRERYRGYRASRYRHPVRALMLAFHRLLAGEGYAQAGVITPGSAFDQRWQEHCGAQRERIRVVYEATPLADRPPVGAEPERPTLAWLGAMEPCGGLEPMLRAFALVREEQPEAELRVYGRTAPSGAAAYQGHCRELAHDLFGDAVTEAVSFDGFDSTSQRLRTVHEDATVLVFAGTEGVRPHLLAESQLSGRPVVATDVGAARELLGPTGLLVPPGDPIALAAACSALLGDEERRVRLGNAGRQRAQELYAVEPAIDAFRTLYLELAAEVPQSAPEPVAQPFSRPAEYWVGAIPKGVPAQ